MTTPRKGQRAWIPGYEGLYEATSAGEIVSHCRWRGGYVPRTLKQNPSTSGYLSVCLAARGRRRTRQVHELMLLTFVGPRPSGKMAAHLDSNKYNNAISNLVWATQSENESHKTTKTPKCSHCKAYIWTWKGRTHMTCNNCGSMFFRMAA